MSEPSLPALSAICLIGSSSALRTIATPVAWSSLKLDGGLGLKDDQATGVAIVRKALEEPIKQIALNAGKEGSLIVQQIRTSKPGEGYDALNDKFVNMFEAGIVDPAKVTRSALQNAASIAAMVLTTEAMVTEVPEEKRGGGMP